MIGLFKPYTVENSEVRLTGRVRECLQLLSDDRCIKQVAHEMNISIDTVNQYLTKARAVLGRKTTVGAVKRAILLGLIS